jgi:hypothetical protein
VYGKRQVYHYTNVEGVPLCQKAPGVRPNSFRLLKTKGDRDLCRFCADIWESRTSTE